MVRKRFTKSGRFAIGLAAAEVATAVSLAVTEGRGSRIELFFMDHTLPRPRPKSSQRDRHGAVVGAVDMGQDVCGGDAVDDGR